MSVRSVRQTNRAILEAFGVSEWESVTSATLELTPDSHPVLTVKRVVNDASAAGFYLALDEFELRPRPGSVPQELREATDTCLAHRRAGKCDATGTETCESCPRWGTPE